MLQPDPSQPGHWIDPARPSGSGGLFALVIGVSSYAHLDGGAGPQARNTYGLSQLKVSALTALRFFDWLRSRYALKGCPLVEAWVLLAPTAAEVAVEARLEANVLEPTFTHCTQAALSWIAAMRSLPEQAARASRAVFFFSGHGIEVFREKQILLPCDYLAPPLEVVNRALSTFNLVAGMATLKVDRQFFFLDACRNDNQDLRKLKVDGTNILDEPAGLDTNPDIVVPILYATAAGQQAYQQVDPKSGLSLYGTALIEGLVATPDIEVRMVDGLWSVTMSPLQSYMKSRVSCLIAESSEPVRQLVKMGGLFEDVTVTQVEGDFAGRRALSSSGPGASLSDLALSRDTIVPPADTLDWQTKARSYFHDESVTNQWTGARLWALSGGQQLGLEALRLLRVKSAPDASRYRVDLTINADDRSGFLLQLEDDRGFTGVMLPADPLLRSGYTIEVDYTLRDASSAGRRTVSRIDAALATCPNGIATLAAQLWNRYESADALSAGRWLAQLQPTSVHRSELETSRLARTLVKLIALRSRQALPWTDVPSLSEPEDSDELVLASERVLQSGLSADTIKQAARLLARAGEHALPMVAECFGLAIGRASMLSRCVDELDAQTLHRVTEIKQRLEEALVYAQLDGLFVVYRGYVESGAPLSLHCPQVPLPVPGVTLKSPERASRKGDPIALRPSGPSAVVNRIQSNPKYQELLRRRNRFGAWLTALVLLVFGGYIALIAFNKPFLARPLGGGMTTIGIPIWLGVIVFAVVITGIYVHRANGKYDALTEQFVGGALK